MPCLHGKLAERNAHIVVDVKR